MNGRSLTFFSCSKYKKFHTTFAMHWHVMCQCQWCDRWEFQTPRWLPSICRTVALLQFNFFITCYASPARPVLRISSPSSTWSIIECSYRLQCFSDEEDTVTSITRRVPGFIQMTDDRLSSLYNLLQAGLARLDLQASPNFYCYKVHERKKWRVLLFI